MNRRLTIVVLAAAGAFAYPRAPVFASECSVPADATAQAERPTVRLVVDTSGMFEDEREDMARWIREDGLPVLTDAGVTVDDANAELELRVAVEVEGVGYAVETAVWKPGADEPEIDRGRRVCEACVRSEVLRLVTHELAWMGGWLAVRPAPEPDAPSTEAEAPDDPATQEPSSRSEPKREPATTPSHALRNAGLALVVPGGVGLGVGIGLMAAGRRTIEDYPDDRVVAHRNYRSPGIAVAAVGGAAVTAGVALLVMHARRTRGRHAKGPVWGPLVGEANVGIMVSGRF